MDAETYVALTIDGITYKLREDVHYSADGLWVAVNGGIARVGIGDHLCRLISPSLHFIEFRRPGTKVRQGEKIGTFEMVNVDLPIPAPVSGVIEEINEELESDLWLLDSDPYGEGWLALLSVTDFSTDDRNLMDAKAYSHMLSTTSRSCLIDDR